MKLSSKLRSGRQKRLTADMSYLEQTAELSKSLTKDDPLELKAPGPSVGNAALGALGGAMGATGMAAAPGLATYGSPYQPSGMPYGGMGAGMRPMGMGPRPMGPPPRMPPPAIMAGPRMVPPIRA